MPELGFLLVALAGFGFMALAIAREAFDDAYDLDAGVDAALTRASWGYPPESRKRFLEGVRDLYAEIKEREAASGRPAS